MVGGVVVSGASAGLTAGLTVGVGVVGGVNGGVVGGVTFVFGPRFARPAANAAASAMLIGMGEVLLEVVEVVVILEVGGSTFVLLPLTRDRHRP